jgi:2-keto-myo-inositol isomerase
MPNFPLALHTWTIDTTPMETALDAAAKAGYAAIELRRSDVVKCYERGKTKQEIIDIIKNSAIPLGILGTEYGWFFAPPEEKARLFGVLRETCEMARRPRSPGILLVNMVCGWRWSLIHSTLL